jgi:hypothetical protein
MNKNYCIVRTFISKDEVNSELGPSKYLYFN